MFNLRRLASRKEAARLIDLPVIEIAADQMGSTARLEHVPPQPIASNDADSGHTPQKRIPGTHRTRQETERDIYGGARCAVPTLQLNVRVPPGLRDEFNMLAKKAGMTQSELFAELLRLYKARTA
jgi:hypothetical protein